jgi:hypothetical protein
MRTPLLVGLLGTALPLRADAVPVTVTAPHDVREAPVSTIVKLPLKTQKTGADAFAGQLEPLGDGTARLTFIARDLKAGVPRTFWVDTSAPAVPGLAVELKRDGENVDFLVGGQKFTRYDTTTGPTKPYFYPLFAPGGKQIVRQWPVEKTESGTKDHPHHRGLWFTHGKVNGVDFWLEGAKTGKTVHNGYETVQSGAVYGLLRAKTDWLTPDGKKIASDARDVRVYNLSSGILMEFSISITALEPLTFGDTKEGTFALRVADSMRAAVEKGKTAEGHILNSNGDKDAKAWGKSAAWCAYYGPVDGETVGVAIFDDPKNLRYPTTWHVRDYGLFAVNPFGLHDFDKKNPAGAGDLTVPAGQSITFRYRLLFHKGVPEDAGVPQMGQSIAAPPLVKIEN